MAKKTKKKTTAKPSASRSTKKAPASRGSSKKKTTKKPAATPKKKVAKKSPARKKVAKKATPTKKKAAAKKPAAKKKAAKKSVAKKSTRPAAKKKALTKKKAVKKKVVKKAAVKKKAATKKPSAKKAPVKKAAPTPKTTKKKSVAKKTTAAKANGKKAATTKKFKPPRVPYAALAAAPAPAYDPLDHEPLTEKQLRRVKTGLTAKDLRYFRQLLLERRAEIIGDVQGLEAARSGNAGEISHMPLHMADVGSDSYEQEFTLDLMEYERRIVVEIDDALQRIVNKTYGVCHESGKPISRPRLEAKPWAKYSIDVARERERRGL